MDNSRNDDETSIENFMDCNGDVLSLKKYRGLLSFPRFRENHYVEEITEMHVRADDVFIHSYPKTGSHWIYEVVYMLLNNTTNYCTEHAYLDDLPLENIDNMASPRILLTHSRYSWLPKKLLENRNKKLINVCRNPKDTSVSMYHYLKKTIESYESSSFSGFLGLFMKGTVPYGSWFQYTKDWEQIRKEDPSILFVQYEELKKNFQKELIRLADYLGVKYNKKFFDAIEEKCSFQKMSKSLETNRAMSYTTKNGSCPVYRKGEIGDWKNYFTVAENEAFDALYKAEMKNSSVIFTFD